MTRPDEHTIDKIIYAVSSKAAFMLINFAEKKIINIKKNEYKKTVIMLLIYQRNSVLEMIEI
jgi:hypothetical protein